VWRGRWAFVTGDGAVWPRAIASGRGAVIVRTSRRCYFTWSPVSRAAKDTEPTEKAPSFLVTTRRGIRSWDGVEGRGVVGKRRTLSNNRGWQVPLEIALSWCQDWLAVCSNDDKNAAWCR
jgi:hypothetical protein